MGHCRRGFLVIYNYKSPHHTLVGVRMEGVTKIDRYQTQWAAQFYVAAELTRRGYLVSLTLGNAPVIDLLVVSPNGVSFKVDVKGQATRNFWLIKRIKPQNDLFYFLVYLPKNLETLKFFIFNSEELMKKREEYKEHIEAKSGKYRDELGGINWGTALDFENKWEKLPK